MVEQLPHASYYADFEEALLGFARYARLQGIKVGIQEVQESLLSVEWELHQHPILFRYALRSIFCSDKEQLELFDQIFEIFWGVEKGKFKAKEEEQENKNRTQKISASRVWMGKNESREDQERDDSENVSGANAVERLRQTDFGSISGIEAEMLEELAMKLWQQMSKRIKKRFKQAQNKGRVDIRNTIRHSLPTGGEPINLYRKKVVPRKQKLVILLDVSGSMDTYSFFLLRFIWALKSHFSKVDAYIFSTTLVRITDILENKHLDHALEILAQYAEEWSSGTKIGECLKAFNHSFAREALSGRSTVIVLSDGLDTGESGLLASELSKIRLRTRKLIWLNPLKGAKIYQPIQQGIVTAMPFLDTFQSGHSLNSLLELENYLLEV
ncbi:MAG: VWA domain-containing protein [Bacteroidota bacterium]